MCRGFLLCASLCLSLLSTSQAQTVRIDIFFENDAIGSNYRDASWGTAQGGDYLRLINGSKMPVETSSAVRGSTSGAVEYQHVSGSWDLFIAAAGWAVFDFSSMDSLVLFLNGPAAVPAGELPRIGIEDGNKVRSGLVNLGDYIEGIDGDAGTWQRVAVPLVDIPRPPEFRIDRFQTVRFASGGPNSSQRTLWVDDIHAIGDVSDVEPPPRPSGLEARGGDRSVILYWEQPPVEVGGYRVYRSENGGEFVPISGLITRRDYVDVTPENDVAYTYDVRSVDSIGIESEPGIGIDVTPTALDDEAFVTLVQRTAFDYFWREANPVTGHVRDRDRQGAACSIAATGMGLTAITIGIERGWITRAEGRERVRRTLSGMWTAPQGTAAAGTSGYRGFFYHFVNCNTGLRAGTSELSTIDTALLMAGVLHVGEFFAGEHADEVSIRTLADNLYRRVEWTWAQVRHPRIGHGWHPESGHIVHDYRGYDEAMILYLLALGSPTHPVSYDAWIGYTQSYRWETHYGFTFLIFPPLFGHQYSHLWVDFRGIRDVFMRNRGSDYFENSVRATLANRAYAIANPMGFAGYGPNSWGFTASDIPDGYIARGAPPAMNDDGTITPTAPGGSFAFAPNESLAALRHMYDQHRERLWGPYGFRDAYNITRDWFATDHIGIDQGPFVIMIENQDNGRVWEVFMRNEHIQRGLEAADFRAVNVSAEELPVAVPFSARVFPNPATESAAIRVEGASPGTISVEVFDALGRRVARHFELSTGGSNTIDIDLRGLAAGLYVLRLTNSDVISHLTLIRQ
jgi:hypothetical protein